MVWPVLAFALVLQATPADLRAASQASLRPRECSPLAKSSVWETAREPHLARYCDLLSRGFGQLGASPKAARETAIEAIALAPMRAAPFVLRGRAEVLLGEHQAALSALDRARKLDPRALEEPGALHAYALALAHLGRRDDALASYRALASRVSLLPGADVRVRVWLEAASLAFSAGSSSLDEAIAFCRQARREPLREAKARVLAMLALGLDRSGASDEARVILEEVARLGGPAAVMAFGYDDLGTGQAEAARSLVDRARPGNKR